MKIEVKRIFTESAGQSIVNPVRLLYNKNIRIAFLDEEYNKEFIDLFKIKSYLGFTIIKIQNNEKVVDEIENNLCYEK